MSHLRMTEQEFKALQDRNKPKAAPKPREEKAQPPSEIEELLALQIEQAGLPEPKREYHHLRGSKHRLDFCWPDRMCGVEVQGNVHRIRERFEADITKRAQGLLQGWRILEVSGKTIRDGRAIEWIKQFLKM